MSLINMIRAGYEHHHTLPVLQSLADIACVVARNRTMLASAQNNFEAGVISKESLNAVVYEVEDYTASLPRLWQALRMKLN